MATRPVVLKARLNDNPDVVLASIDVDTEVLANYLTDQEFLQQQAAVWANEAAAQALVVWAEFTDIPVVVPES